jgi:hypothetical protein
VDILRPIGFTDALRRLHGMLGSEVKVAVNDYGLFFGCGFEGALERVQTLPPDDTAVRLVLRDGAGFFLDPADVEVFVGGGFSEGPTWLEFHLDRGPTVTVEASTQRRCPPPHKSPRRPPPQG